MLVKIVCMVFFSLVLTFPSAYAADGTGKGNASPGLVSGSWNSYDMRGLDVEGGMQGRSVGFVDVDGDGSADMVVGAPYAESSSGIGALLVVKGLPKGGFARTPYMFLTGDDNFGYSFVNLGDVDGDGNEDFAAGAISGNGADVSLSGSVTVFKGGRKGNHAGRRPLVIAKVSGENPMAKFGIALAAGDLNGDGLKDLIVGAPFNTNNPAVYQGGAVYVYLAPDFDTKIALRASSARKGLGWAVAAGDLNADGIQDLCVSATGNVFCYYGGRSFSPVLDSPDVTVTSASGGFGKALAIVGDLDGDGFGELLVGAPNSVVGTNTNTGSVYIVRGGTGTRKINVDSPSADLIVRIDGEGLYHRFGSSIAVTDNVDGDNKPDIAIGAPMADTASTSLTGRVYFFRGAGISASATVSDSVVFEGFAANQGYGVSMAAAGDGWLLIGAPWAGRNAGGVSMVDLKSGGSAGR